MERDLSKLDEEERGRLGIRPLPSSLEAALDALESDAVVRSWFSQDLLDCYLSVKRTEISFLEGVEPKEACERYLRVY
jgi:glutamine synthetase